MSEKISAAEAKTLETIELNSKLYHVVKTGHRDSPEDPQNPKKRVVCGPCSIPGINHDIFHWISLDRNAKSSVIYCINCGTPYTIDNNYYLLIEIK